MDNNIINAYSSLSLAFLGDAVFSLMVREYLLSNSDMHTAKLHKLSAGAVNAGAQSRAIKKIIPLLNETELEVFKRGRNAHPKHTPKNQSEADYRYATGLEALFGYLYLEKNDARLKELFNFIIENSEVPYFDSLQE